jgi:hypothetical protein
LIKLLRRLTISFSWAFKRVYIRPDSLGYEINRLSGSKIPRNQKNSQIPARRSQLFFVVPTFFRSFDPSLKLNSIELFRPNGHAIWWWVGGNGSTSRRHFMFTLCVCLKLGRGLISRGWIGRVSMNSFLAFPDGKGHVWEFGSRRKLYYMICW